MVSAFLADIVGKDGLVSPDRLSGRLKITTAELAAALGLSRDSVSRRDRITSITTQQRLRDMVEIIDPIVHWMGSELAAFAWYRSQPLPSFGDLTAEDFVRAGRGKAVSQPDCRRRPRLTRPARPHLETIQPSWTGSSANAHRGRWRRGHHLR